MLDFEQQQRLVLFVKGLHNGQYDKMDRPYYEHLERVASAFVPGSDEWVTAWLHDAIEDGHATEESLLGFGVSPLVIQALNLLNHQKGEKYHLYICKIRMDTTPAGNIARRVKISDILDNSDPSRIFYLKEEHRYYLLIKYNRALKDLLL